MEVSRLEEKVKRNAVMLTRIAGGDETGSANYTLYDPTSLVLGAAQKGTPVVFVAMNYRLNGKSHPAAPRRAHTDIA